MIEYWEDAFEANPKLFKEVSKEEYGEVIYENTGDDFVDKWEQEIAQGLVPDLTEAFPKDAAITTKKKKPLDGNIVELLEDINFNEYKTRK